MTLDRKKYVSMLSFQNSRKMDIASSVKHDSKEELLTIHLIPPNTRAQFEHQKGFLVARLNEVTNVTVLGSPQVSSIGQALIQNSDPLN